MLWGLRFSGGAVASGAGYVVGDRVVFGDGEGGALAVAGVAVALRVDDMDGGGSAGVATLEAEGGRLGALAADGGGGGVAEDAPFATDAAASAVLACATGVGDDLVVVDLHGEAHLQLFHGGIHGVADACLDGVDAVLVGAGTHATTEGLVADIALAGAGVLTAEDEDGGSALGAGEGALEVALGDGTEDEIGDAVSHLVVGVDRRVQEGGR